MCVLASALATACAGDLKEPTPPSGENTGDEPLDDPAEGGGEPPSIIDEFPPTPALVDTRLDVQGNSLVLALENLTDVTATVALSAMVENPDALHATDDAGRVVLAAHESAEVVLAAPAVAGLDRLRQGWTDARVSVQAYLDDGRTWGAPVAIFVEDGRSVAPREVVASGVAHGFKMPPEPERGTPRGGIAVEICFANAVLYSGVTENNLDFHRGTSQIVFAAGMEIIALPPNSDALEPRFLDNNGCTSFPRTIGVWQFQIFLRSQHFPRVNVSMTARGAQNGIPSRFVTQTVGATGDPPRVSFTMPAGEAAQLQTALATVMHTASRANSLGAIVNPDDLTIRIGDATNYTHSTGTIQVTTSSAVRRFSVSHETGHWLHRNWQPTVGSDYTYCAAGDAGCTPPAPDDCSRSTAASSHSFRSVEWNSVAHNEGMASFFSAVAFNSVFNGADCFLPDNGGLSCESEGKTLETGLTGNGPCFEWQDNMFFSVAVEHDWTKMYWDFVADEGQNFVTYLTNERNLTGLTRANRAAKIFEGLSTAMNQALRRAAIGNIQEGAAH